MCLILISKLFLFSFFLLGSCFWENDSFFQCQLRRKGWILERGWWVFNWSSFQTLLREKMLHQFSLYLLLFNPQSSLVLLLIEDIQLLRPTIFPSVPRLFNRIRSKILQGTINSGSVIKAALFRKALESKISGLQLVNKLLPNQTVLSLLHLSSAHIFTFPSSPLNLCPLFLLSSSLMKSEWWSQTYFLGCLGFPKSSSCFRWSNSIYDFSKRAHWIRRLVLFSSCLWLWNVGR